MEGEVDVGRRQSKEFNTCFLDREFNIQGQLQEGPSHIEWFYFVGLAKVYNFESLPNISEMYILTQSVIYRLT